MWKVFWKVNYEAGIEWYQFLQSMHVYGCSSDDFNFTDFYIYLVQSVYDFMRGQKGLGLYLNTIVHPFLDMPTP